MIERLEAQMRAMQMLSKAQEVTADNLANINTPGFKGSNVFYRMFTEKVNGEEVTTTRPMQEITLKQGVLEPTGNAFDFGIQGEGFFSVKEGEQSFLTRDGRFHMDSDGYLVNSRGARVQGSGGDIHIPEYFQASTRNGGAVKLEVATDGTLRLDGEVYDQIKMISVDEASSLERKGSNYYSAAPGSLRITTSGKLMQGYYEKGNVEPLNEMVDMMRTMRMFESQQRAMRSTDEMLGQVTTRLGKF